MDDARMSETCEECGAVVGDYDMHRRWHFDLDHKIKSVEDEARRDNPV